jgi:hypothetical protein
MIGAMQASVADPRLVQTVNDDVMGGCSSARVLEAADAVRFKGVLRLDHGGGFAPAPSASC